MVDRTSIRLVPVPLLEAFPAGSGRRLAVIGAGGKTTTIRRIADLQAYRDPPVVLTTTTRIREDQAVGPLYERYRHIPGDPPSLLTMGRAPETEQANKLRSPEETSLLKLLDTFSGRVLIEADGAAQAKLKVHRDFEPVVPDSIDAQLSMFDLSVIGDPADDSTVHSCEQWERWFPGERTVSHDLVAELFFRDEGYDPPEGVEHWLAMTHPGGLRQDLVSMIAEFPDRFWTLFNRIVVLENRNIFRLHFESQETFLGDRWTS